jgi:hypothetical protein
MIAFTAFACLALALGAGLGKSGMTRVDTKVPILFLVSYENHIFITTPSVPVHF